MKLVTSLSKRLRVSLSLFTALAVLPLGSTLQSVQAKPKRGAPAYGYRAKSKEDKRYRRTTRRTVRRTTRYSTRRDDDRGYDIRYRTITTRDGRRVRQYYRVYR